MESNAELQRKYNELVDKYNMLLEAYNTLKNNVNMVCDAPTRRTPTNTRYNSNAFNGYEEYTDAESQFNIFD